MNALKMVSSFLSETQLPLLVLFIQLPSADMSFGGAAFKILGFGQFELV